MRIYDVCMSRIKMEAVQGECGFDASPSRLKDIWLLYLTWAHGSNM